MSALRVNSGTGNGKSPRWTFHFRVGSGRRTGSSGRFGNGGLEGRGFLDGSCSRPDMRLLSERNATSANDQDFTSGYCQKGNRSHRVGRPEHQTQAALATKHPTAKALHDRRGGARTLESPLSGRAMANSSKHRCQRPPCYFAWGCFRYFSWKREPRRPLRLSFPLMIAAWLAKP